MRAVDHYPADTVTGCCFVLGKFTVEPGEQVVDLDKAVEFLPPHGRLCVSELAVKEMVKVLGWTLQTAETTEQMQALAAENRSLLDQNDELATALRGLVNLPLFDKAREIIHRRETADKEAIAGWMDTLERAR